MGGDKTMIKLKINTENQAFDQAEGQEVARILRGLADQVEHLDKLQECQLPLRDINGNTVGYYQTWSDQDDQDERQVSSPYATWKNIEDVVENALGEYPERLTLTLEAAASFLFFAPFRIAYKPCEPGAEV